MKKILLFSFLVIMLAGCEDVWDTNVCNGEWSVSGTNDDGGEYSVSITVNNGAVSWFSASRQDDQGNIIFSMLIAGLDGSSIADIYYDESEDGYWFDYCEPTPADPDYDNHFLGHFYPDRNEAEGNCGVTISMADNYQMFTAVRE